MTPVALRPGRASMRWWQIVAIAITIVIFPAYTLIMVALFAPLLLIHVLGPRMGDSAVVPAAFALLAVSLHPLHRLWQDDGAWSTAVAVVTDTRMLAADYGAAALMWVIAEITSLVLRAIAERQRVIERQRVQGEVDALRAEWQIASPKTAD